MRYIGSKQRVLPFIEEVVSNTYGDVSTSTVADLFAGTACVGDMFKRKGARIISNDYLRFSYALQIAKIKVNNYPNCKITYETALRRLNAVSRKKGFFYTEYTLEGTYGKEFSRNYFSAENAQKIDAICITLQNWLIHGQINYEMYYLLAASLIDAITKISNTSGTYGAFLKSDDSRKFKPLILYPFRISNNNKHNKCYCREISEIINHVTGEILYLDPPYNSRQYPPYYHILETAVLYDKPAIYGITGRRPYEDKLSQLCIKNKAQDILRDIIIYAKFKHIYVSYSTDGIINIENLMQELKKSKKFDVVDCYHKGYRRYKSNGGGNLERNLKELILYAKKR